LGDKGLIEGGKEKKKGGEKGGRKGEKGQVKGKKIMRDFLTGQNQEFFQQIRRLYRLI